MKLICVRCGKVATDPNKAIGEYCFKKSDPNSGMFCSGRLVELKNPIIEVIRKLDESIPVVWDRWTKNDDGFYVVYGWIVRSDGQRDFVIVMMYDSEPVEDVFFTTSSAKYSKEIMRVLYGSAEDHNDCRKIEELFAESTTA